MLKYQRFSPIIYLLVIAFCTSFNILHSSTKTTTTTTGINAAKKTTQQQPQFKDYNNIIFTQTSTLNAAPGTKSVIMNRKGNRLYAMNLEGMSVYEFDVRTKELLREFKFKPTKAMGWDYSLHKPIASFEEKPVEAFITHNDEILWVSLHNAHGIVPIHLNNLSNYNTAKPHKKIYIINHKTQQKDSAYIPFIATGKTPKVIAATVDDKYLLVSNWHSNNVSVLSINDSAAPYGKVISTVAVSSIPRGIAIDDKNQKSYVAIMGGNTVAVINHQNWKVEQEITVAATPRHILLDKQNRLLVSYNSLGKIACLKATDGTKLFSAKTNYQPRTIAMSKNQQFLFTTCYTGNTVDVFKIGDTSFTKLYTLPCKGKPVGVDVYEDDSTIEAWVCNYVGGNIKVFSFKKE